MLSLAAAESFVLVPDRLLIDTRRIRVVKRTLPSGAIQRGDVVGRVAGDVTSTPDASNVGDGEIEAIMASATVRIGTYRAVCVAAAEDGGRFHVEDPDGRLIGVAEVGTPFVGSLAFTISAGDDDFAVNDSFLLEVADSGAVAIVSSAAPLGAATAWGIAATGHDASVEPQEVLVYESGGQFNASELRVGDGASLDAVRQELTRRGIIVRGSMPN